MAEELKFTKAIRNSQGLEATLSREDIIGNDNVLQLLDDKTIQAIESHLSDCYNDNLNSISQYLEDNAKLIELAYELHNRKATSGPFRNAANIRFPLVTKAALNFYAQAYALLFPTDKPISARTIGHANDVKRARALRVTTYMNYDVNNNIEEYDPETQKLLIALSIIGQMYRKIWRSDQKRRNAVKTLFPHQLLVNHNAGCLKDEDCITELHFMSSNDVVAKIRDGSFIDFEPEEGVSFPVSDVEKRMNELNRVQENLKASRYQFANMYVNLDLDGDGYKEPYIGVMTMPGKKLVSLVRNFEPQDIIGEDLDGNITKIEPMEYFVDFKFLPNFSGKHHGIGLGMLLAPITKTVSTSVNMLLNAGKISTSLGGFASRQLGLTQDSMSVDPFKLRIVNGKAADIKNGVTFWPDKAPSPVLLNLIQMFNQQGDQLIQLTDMNQGENPGQNQPLGTSRLVLERSQQLFKAIYKNLWNSFGKEFRLLFKLNKENLDIEDYRRVLDMEDIQQTVIDPTIDFEEGDKDIIPTAARTADDATLKILKANDIAAVAPNKEKAMRVALEAYGAEEFGSIDEFMQAPPQQPTVEEQIKMKELEHKINKENIELELASLEIKYNAIRDRAGALKSLAQAQAIESDMDVKASLAELEKAAKQVEAQDELIRRRLEHMKMAKELEQGDSEDASANGRGEVSKVDGGRGNS